MAGLVYKEYQLEKPHCHLAIPYWQVRTQNKRRKLSKDRLVWKCSHGNPPGAQYK